MENEKEKIAMQSELLLKTRLESEGFAEFVQVTKIHEQFAHQRMHPHEVFEKVTEAIKTYNNYLQKKGLDMENPQLASLMFNHRKFYTPTHFKRTSARIAIPRVERDEGWKEKLFI